MKNRTQLLLALTLLTLVLIKPTMLATAETSTIGTAKDWLKYIIWDEKNPAIHALREALTSASDEVVKKALFELFVKMEEKWPTKMKNWDINMYDTTSFLNIFTNPDLILDALKVGDAILNADYKKGIGIAEIRFLKVMAATPNIAAWLPYANIFIVALDVFGTYCQYLDESIYTINKRQVYKYYQNDVELLEPDRGVDLFIERYFNNYLQLRAFVYEYAQKDMGLKIPLTKEPWWKVQENQTLLRVIVNTLRNEMFNIYQQEIKVKQAREWFEDELDSLKQFHQFVEQNQPWLTKRLKELEIELNIPTDKNQKLNDAYQSKITTIKSPFSQEASKRFDILLNEYAEQEKARVNALLAANQHLYSSIDKQIAAFQKRPLDTLIAKKVYNSSSPDSTSNYTLYENFAPVYPNSAAYDKPLKEYVDTVIKIYPRVENVDSYLKQQDHTKNWYVAGSFTKELDAVQKRSEDLNTFVQDVTKTLSSIIAGENAIIDTVNNDISLIQLTGYEKWDVQIRTKRDNYYVAASSHKYALEKDQKCWENIASQKEAILQDYQEITNTIQDTADFGKKIHQEFNTVQEKNRLAAESLKAWEEKGFSNLPEYFNSGRLYENIIPSLFASWMSFFADSGLNMPFSNNIIEETIAYGYQKTSNDGYKFTEYAGNLNKKYLELPSKQYLSRSVVETKKTGNKYEIVPKEFTELDAINYPVAPPDAPYSEVVRAANNRMNFDNAIEVRKKFLKEIQINVADYLTHSSRIYDDMLTFASDIQSTCYQDAIGKVETIAKNTCNTIILEMEAFKKAMENYTSKMNDLIARTNAQRAAFLAEERQFQQEAISATETDDAKNLIPLQSWRDKQRTLINEIDKLSRYFTLAINQRNIGYAETLYLGAKARSLESQENTKQAENHYVQYNFTSLQKDAEKILGEIIDINSQIITRLKKMEDDLNPLVTNISTLPEDTKHIAENINVDDLIAGRTDSDHDGYSDIQELNWGTDPLNNSDVPNITEGDEGDTGDNGETPPDIYVTNVGAHLYCPPWSDNTAGFYIEDNDPASLGTVEFYMDMLSGTVMPTLTIRCLNPSTGIYDAGSSDFTWAPESGYLPEETATQGHYYAVKDKNGKYIKIYLKTCTLELLSGTEPPYYLPQGHSLIQFDYWYQSNGSRYLKK